MFKEIAGFWPSCWKALTIDKLTWRVHCIWPWPSTFMEKGRKKNHQKCIKSLNKWYNTVQNLLGMFSGNTRPLTTHCLSVTDFATDWWNELRGTGRGERESRWSWRRWVKMAVMTMKESRFQPRAWRVWWCLAPKQLQTQLTLCKVYSVLRNDFGGILVPLGQTGRQQITPSCICSCWWCLHSLENTSLPVYPRYSSERRVNGWAPLPWIRNT